MENRTGKRDYSKSRDFSRVIAPPRTVTELQPIRGDSPDAFVHFRIRLGQTTSVFLIANRGGEGETPRVSSCPLNLLANRR